MKLAIAIPAYNEEKSIESIITRSLAAGEYLISKAFDLCYTNGVFHHVDPAARLSMVQRIYRALAPGEFFALFENNP